MNLGDGLKLETELLDGKTKLILASYERKPKTAVKMGNKAKIPKQSLRTPQTGHVLKSTQNTNGGRNESPLWKNRTASEASLAKGNKSRMIYSPTKLDPDNDHLCVQRNITSETPDSGRTQSSKQSAVFKQKPQKTHITIEELRNSLVCLTEEQLQQILLAVNRGNRPVSQTENGKKEEKCQNNLHFNNFSDESEDNIMGLLQKAENGSPIPDENNSILNKKQKTSKQCEQKIAIKTVWKPADMFSTLGEREREKSFLEAKKFQWRKELDEQVALKKKEKAASEEQRRGTWDKCGNARFIWDNFQTIDGGSQSSMSPSSILSRSPNLRLSAHPGGDSVPGTSQSLEMSPLAAEETQALKNVCRGRSSAPDPSPCCGPHAKPSTFSSPDLPAAIRTAFVLGEATPLEHPFSAVKKEQQRKWIEELNKQKEEDKQRKLQEKMMYSKGEEHDRWAMHFDSLKLYPNSQSQFSSRATQKQPDFFCLSPDTQEITDVGSPYTPLSGSQLEPSEEENLGKSIRDTAANNEKTNFLRSMTALLDPAQIEERDRRRQKQLEHQKAIIAQVEEKRRKKQLEEQRRKQEEEEEERRLAREREEMQRRFEEDLLEQKRKEEMMTLKTNELYQTMQKAQELAQRLKQEQRIRDLEQKGHDISNLRRNLGGDAEPAEQSLGPSDPASAKVSPGIHAATSPRKDTAVQTDDSHPGRDAHLDARADPTTEGALRALLSPEASELDGHFNSKKSKREVPPEERREKENGRLRDPYDPFARTEKPAKHKGKGAKRPDWNLNQPARRYVPASERYPKHLQRQREEKKLRRQMELLQLLHRNAPGSLAPPRDASPEAWAHQEQDWKKPSPSKARPESPPIPAVKHHAEIQPPEPAHFVPYVRTNEIYCLEPEVLPSRALAYDPPYSDLNESNYPEQPGGSDNTRDPLFNPNLVKNRDRQQAILKGLSDLRQGLLQKQKELETHLMPLASGKEDFESPF